MATKDRDIIAAAEAVEHLRQESLALVAESQGLTVQQLRLRLDLKLLELAERGDIDAIRMLSERTAGAVLGPIERVRSARRLARRVEKALGAGLISVSEAQKLTQLVRLRQELERDNFEERIREVEGVVKERVG